jgi:ribosomal protein S18 acetylase RimI-like enzyme
MTQTTYRIDEFRPRYLDAIVALSLRAWAPVFPEIEKSLDPQVYQASYPDGWRISQKNAVESVCTGGEARVWVALDAAVVVGFVALSFQPGGELGEIYMIAVDPDHQRRGVGAALTQFAVQQLRAAKVSIAMVETGSDPGHAPARRAYEKAGFSLMPVSRYFMKL